MKQQIREFGRRGAYRLAPTMMASISEVRHLRDQVNTLSRDVKQLRTRITSLESEIQETRRLHRRVAEITDLVEEAVLPADDRNGDRLGAALERYTDTM